MFNFSDCGTFFNILGDFVCKRVYKDAFRLVRVYHFRRVHFLSKKRMKVDTGLSLRTAPEKC